LYQIWAFFEQKTKKGAKMEILEARWLLLKSVPEETLLKLHRLENRLWLKKTQGKLSYCMPVWWQAGHNFLAGQTAAQGRYWSRELRFEEIIKRTALFRAAAEAALRREIPELRLEELSEEPELMHRCDRIIIERVPAPERGPAGPELSPRAKAALQTLSL